jgi:hypothetical protein
MATKDPLLTRVVLETNYKNKNWQLPELAISYDDLIWSDDSPKPTPDDIEEQYEEIISGRWKTQHSDTRKGLYPSIDELVVALWEKLVEEDGISSELIDSIQERRLQVKESNPKLNSIEDAQTPMIDPQD